MIQNDHWTLKLSPTGRATFVRWLAMLGLHGEDDNIDIDDNGTVMWRAHTMPATVLFQLSDGEPPPLTAENLKSVLALTSQRAPVATLPMQVYTQVSGGQSQLRALGEGLGARLLLALAILSTLMGEDWQHVHRLLDGTLTQNEIEKVVDVSGIDASELYVALRKLYEERFAERQHRLRTVQEPVEDAPNKP